MENRHCCIKMAPSSDEKRSNSLKFGPFWATERTDLDCSTHNGYRQNYNLSCHLRLRIHHF